MTELARDAYHAEEVRCVNIIEGVQNAYLAEEVGYVCTKEDG